MWKGLCNQRPSSEDSGPPSNTEEESISRPQSKQLHFVSKMQALCILLSDHWGNHGHTFELWNALNLGDFEEFTFLVKSWKFLGIPKYALPFSRLNWHLDISTKTKFQWNALKLGILVTYTLFDKVVNLFLNIYTSI